MNQVHWCKKYKILNTSSIYNVDREVPSLNLYHETFALTKLGLSARAKKALLPKWSLILRVNIGQTNTPNRRRRRRKRNLHHLANEWVAKQVLRQINVILTKIIVVTVTIITKHYHHVTETLSPSQSDLDRLTNNHNPRQSASDRQTVRVLETWKKWNSSSWS